MPALSDANKGDRIDIAVSEIGASVAMRKVNQLASSLQRLSPSAAKSLRAKALRLGLNIEKVVQDVACAALDTVVHATPHDTGRARANWTTTIRISRPANTPRMDDYDYQGDATVAAGQALIKTTRRPPGSVIYISNALPYIRALNEGWSAQSPAMFVEMAVQHALQVARNAKILKG